MGQFSGVGAQQVMEGVTARFVLGEQVGLAQFGEQAADLGQGEAGQAGGGVEGDIRARGQAEQPEHPCCLRGQLPAGPGERGPDAGGRVPGVQRGQPPLLVAQFPGQRGQREARVGQRARGGDGQRQRQPGAQPDELGGRARLGGEPLRAQATGQQFTCVAVGEHVQGERVRTFGGDQPGQRVSAGDQHQAGGAGRQQRADLRLVAGVVGHDQHLLARQQRPVQPGLGCQLGRDPLARHAEGFQEPADRLARRDRGAGGVEAAQVHIQLPVGEAVCGLMGPVHRQRGLAHPGGPADRGDHHRARRAGRLPGQPVELPDLLPAAGEVPHPGRQLPRHRRRAGHGDGLRW
jgi:hypothetical protein